MQVILNLGRKQAVMLAGSMVFLASVIFVVAFGGSNPAVLGHTISELQGTVCPGTQKLTVNASGIVTCAADVDTDSNTQCDDQNCATIDIDGMGNSDGTEVTMNGDGLFLNGAGGGVSHAVRFSNFGRAFSIFVDNSINNGNLIFQDATSAITSMRLQEGGGPINMFTSLTVSSTVSVNGGSTQVFRCTNAGVLPVGALTTVPGGGNCGASPTDTGLRVS